MSDKRVFIGVDPGMKGALCALDPRDQQITFISLGLPVPQLFQEISELVERIKRAGLVPTAMIENVHAIQGTSAKSNFQFGYNVGSINTILMALKIPLDTITPKKWQAYLGVNVKGNLIKKDVAQRVARLYPAASLTGPRGGLLDGNSDALAIAHYHYKTSVINQ